MFSVDLLVLKKIISFLACRLLFTTNYSHGIRTKSWWIDKRLEEYDRKIEAFQKGTDDNILDLAKKMEC